METSHQQPLSIESFSYSWLANLKPSLETLLDAADDESSPASSFIEMDPRMPPSKRFYRNYSHDFNFDFPNQSPPIALVHADELFADGYVMPFFLRKANSATASPDSTRSTVASEDSSEPAVRDAKTRRCSSLRRYCGKFISRRVLEKYLELIGPLLGRLSGRRGGGPRNQRSLSSRSEGMVIMDNNNNKKKRVNNRLAMKRWLSAGEAEPPRVSAAWSEEGWRRSASSSCDSESSIQEAVLHCKRSFGK